MGVFELIERDAFWYYSRHGGHIITLPSRVVLENVQPDSQLTGVFTFKVLPSPFAINVCQVTYYQPTPQGAFTARGTGAKLSFGAALRRAYSECIQLLFPLQMDEQRKSTLDMRSLWQDGSAAEVFPWFFDLDETQANEEFIPKDYSHEELVDSLEAQDVDVFWVTLVNTGGFTVVHVALTGIGLLDSSYYRNNRRFDDFERLLGYTPRTNPIFRPSIHVVSHRR